jgi:hypothetical protein
VLCITAPANCILRVGRTTGRTGLTSQALAVPGWTSRKSASKEGRAFRGSSSLRAMGQTLAGGSGGGKAESGAPPGQFPLRAHTSWAIGLYRGAGPAVFSPKH